MVPMARSIPDTHETRLTGIGFDTTIFILPSNGSKG
jgi:hypothetical protein